jgi:transcriptional regulator with XRE-family HTH domain
MNRIRELRLSKGMSQEDLGKVLNVQKSAVSKYETGRASLTEDILLAVAAYFGVSTDYVLGNEAPNLLGDPLMLGHRDDQAYKETLEIARKIVKSPDIRKLVADMIRLYEENKNERTDFNRKE